MKLQSVRSQQQHMRYLQRRKFLMKKWYRLFIKRGMQYSQSGSRIQDTNIAALMSLVYDERSHADKSEFAQIELWIPVKKK